VDDVVVHGKLLGDGVGHQHTALQSQLLGSVESSGNLRGGVHAVVHLEAALAGVEGGQLLGAVADDGHAVGLQVLQSQAQVQDGLGAGAHHHHGGGSQLLQVGGDVHGGLGAPVDAADAAGGEDLDAGHMGDHHGGGNGGGAVGLASHQHS